MPATEESEAVVEAGGPAQRLSAELREIAALLNLRAVTFRDLMERLEGRGYTLLLVLLCLPFCTPISIPYLSTPFGTIIVVLGLRFALGHHPWLPGKLLDTQIPRRIFSKILAVAGKVVSWMEKVLRPNRAWLFEQPWTKMCVGTMIACSGALLLLPLPIPFSNMLPAVTIVLAASSFSERDARVLLAAAILFGVTLSFFVLIAIFGVAAIQWIQEALFG